MREAVVSVEYEAPKSEFRYTNPNTLASLANKKNKVKDSGSKLRSTYDTDDGRLRPRKARSYISKLLSHKGFID